MDVNVLICVHGSHVYMCRCLVCTDTCGGRRAVILQVLCTLFFESAFSTSLARAKTSRLGDRTGCPRLPGPRVDKEHTPLSSKPSSTACCPGVACARPKLIFHGECANDDTVHEVPSKSEASFPDSPSPAYLKLTARPGKATFQLTAMACWGKRL